MGFPLVSGLWRFTNPTENQLSAQVRNLTVYLQIQDAELTRWLQLKNSNRIVDNFDER